MLAARPRSFPFSLLVTLCLLLGALVCLSADAAPPPVTTTNVLVDQAAGVDKAGCGDEAMPCKTISFALKEHEGQSPNVYIRPGRYVERLRLNEDVTLVGGFTTTGPIHPTRDDRTIIDGDGGGTVIAIAGADVTLASLTITGGAEEYGGGVYASDGIVEIESCAITDNSANVGAGIYVDGAHAAVVVSDSLLTDNAAVLAGGAAACLSGDLQFWHSLLADNVCYSEDGGAIAAATNADVEVRWCEVLRNASGHYGGAFAIGNGTNLLVYNSLIVGSQAASLGNVLYAADSDANIGHCTVANNGNAAGADHAVWLADGSVITYESIWWGNGTNFAQTMGGGQTWEVVYCDVERGWVGQGNIKLDPQFVGEGDYHLTPGSPCIDALRPAMGDTPDLDGVPRPQDGDGDGLWLPDMGCYEAARLYRMFLPMAQ